jgi:hypothetical protein
MNNKSILAVPLIAGAILFKAGIASAAPTSSQNEPPARQDQRGEMMQPRTPPPPPPPSQPAPPSREESPTWMPMRYNMPMHYRMLEPEMIYGYQLMTPRERLDYMNRIHSARSFEERDRLRLEHHRLMQERARRRHIELPDMRGPGGGYGPGPGPGRGPGPGPGPRW